uniref:Uncharacterized protein n=1 Tax=Myotis myotis TaxID=51298 RepID=A0A7J7QT99_MYOMY|nr:hypothetical protein mMyoMyo1_011835 [Myotis myotis]
MDRKEDGAPTPSSPSPQCDTWKGMDLNLDHPEEWDRGSDDILGSGGHGEVRKRSESLGKQHCLPEPCGCHDEGPQVEWLKQHGVILLWSGGHTSAIGRPAGTKVLLAGPSGGSRADPTSCLSSSWGCCVLGAWPCRASLTPPPQPPTCLLFPGTPVIPGDPPGHPGSSCLSGSTAGSAKPPLPCEVTWAQAWGSERNVLDTENIRERTGLRLGAQSVGGAGGWTAERAVPKDIVHLGKFRTGQRRERDGVSCQSLAWNLHKGQGRVGIEAIGLRTSSCSNVSAQQPRSFSPALGRPRGRGPPCRGRFEVLATTLLRTKTRHLPGSASGPRRFTGSERRRWALTEETGQVDGTCSEQEARIPAGPGAHVHLDASCVAHPPPPPPHLSLREEECGGRGPGRKQKRRQK